MIYDEYFLEQLELQQQRTIYVKIIALSQDERELECIEGVAKTGTINIDGKSAVRRTCQLSLMTDEVNISDYLWSLNNKFKLEIGLENLINPNYPEIIWFPQGVFIITTFSSALTPKSYTINISGKDKMCLLNGEIGGTFNSQIDFGKLEVITEEDTPQGPKSQRQLIKIPVKKIIREMVHQYGNEPFHNIIINDLDDTGLELLEYRYDEPLYIYRKAHDDIQNFTNGTIDGNTIIYLKDPTKSRRTETAKISEGGENEEEGKFIYDSLKRNSQVHPTEVYFDAEGTEPYIIAKIAYGDTAGYRETELVYPGDLIAKPGETITAILDKIQQVLVFYEYFYNVSGQFVFQKKRADLPISYSFEGSKLITSFNNTPDLKNAKNDFTVWGERNGEGGSKIPIHMRTAIQQKPKKYHSITVADKELEKYNKAYDLKTKGQNGELYDIEHYDWRELIYQMSLDYRKYNHLDNFELKVTKANPWCFNGRTNYEPYYIDLEGFWRQLYNPEVRDIPKLEEEQKKLQEEIQKLKEQEIVDQTELAKKEAELKKVQNKIEHLQNFYPETANQDLRFWNKRFKFHPENFNFDFELIETGSIAEDFSVEAIGNRPKVVNNTKIKSISYREVPWIIFGEVPEQPKTGYRYFNVPNFENAFSISAQTKSAEDEIRYLLNTYSYCLESVTIKAIPVYRLDPNVLISINDPTTGINGNYSVSKYSISLQHNAMMNIVAVKDVNKIY